MMRFLPLRDFILQGLVGTAWEGTATDRGPDVPDIPGRCFILTRGGGPGFNTEMLFDASGWQVRSVGEQNDPDDAEGLALEIDRVLVSTPSQYIDGIWVPSIQRFGSPPSHLSVDDADRTHFVCNYIVDARSAVV